VQEGAKLKINAASNIKQVTYKYCSILFAGAMCACVGSFFIVSKNLFLQEHYFPFLWMALFLIFDPLAYYIRGSSLIQRLGKRTFILLIASIPFWLVFASLNDIFLLWKNRPEANGGLSEIFYGISHASIIPSFFALLYLIYPKLDSLKPQKALGVNWTWFWMVVSVICFSLLCFFPKALYPILWIFLFLFFDALNWRGKSLSILYGIKTFKIGPLLAVCSTGILLGLYWEGLDVISQTAWSYHLPYFGKYAVFGMPILGYLGYAAFGANILAFSVWLLSLMSREQKDYL
jgi:hypothetical protein